MREYSVIKTDGDLSEFRKYLLRSGITVLAMDFESESNLHEYGEKLCLIQIFDGKRFFIVDPFGISRDEIAKLLEDKKVIKLFYGCESDLSLVYKQYQAKVKSVLDIKNMVDVLGLEKRGLDSVLSSVLNVAVSDKKHYQMYNWTLRPVRKEALEYALSDVEHLFELKDRLMERILAAGKSFELVCGIVQNRNEFDGTPTPTVLKSNEFRMLGREEKGLFLKLYDLRDAFARQLNFPPNVVLPKDQMFGIVSRNIGVARISFNDKVPESVRTPFVAAIAELMKA